VKVAARPCIQRTDPGRAGVGTKGGVMAIDQREWAPTARVMEPVALPARRASLQEVAAWMIVSVLMGVAAGAVIQSLVTAGNETVRAAEIQTLRADAVVDAYEQAWLAVQPTESQVRLTGTGPGLAWVAEQQAAWAEHAITETGPGLVTVAKMQAGYGAGSEPTGTGPGLEHLPGPAGPEVAIVGTP
jgi:hypothetical protein